MKRFGLLLAAILVATAGVTVYRAPADTFEAIMLKDGPQGLPIPFIRQEGSSFAASLQQIGQTGADGSIAVYLVSLSQTTSLDEQQHLSTDTIYLVRTSGGAEPVPFDIAFTEVEDHVPDYFLYKYSDAGATQEIANRESASFTTRFPGRFAASEQAWINESQHGNALSTFEAQHGISFDSTSNDGNGVRFEANAMYAIVVNEPSGSTLRLHAPAVCADGWMMGSETCDDGNALNGDGCSSACVVETGYVCTGNPSVCALDQASSSSSSEASSSSAASSSSEESSSSSSETSSSSSAEQSSSSSSEVSSSSSAFSSQESSSSSVASIDTNEDEHFTMQNDLIPNFTKNPTVVAIRDGAWSDPTIWNTGVVPTDDDVVRIESDVTVQYDVQSDASLLALGVKGNLLFARDRNTRLRVTTLQVYPQGYLEVGTTESPIPLGTTAEIIITDRPLDTGTVQNPGIDPLQWGNGLLAYGKVRMAGAPKEITWIRLSDIARAGDTSIQTAGAMTDWLPGETVVFPDGRQPFASADGTEPTTRFGAYELTRGSEERVIQSIDGDTITLTQPLQFHHSGALNLDGDMAYLPYIGVLDRNIVVRSENPNGIRGHLAFMDRADIDVRHVRFKDLGRTDAFQNVNNTAYANDELVHIGTNQAGRYAVHFYRLIGPVNEANTGHQFVFTGNTVDRARKWSVALDGSSYGLLEENVVYDGQGAGFVAQSGTEIGNDFERNFVLKMVGTYQETKEDIDSGEYARGGNGFWFRRSGSNVRENIVADASHAGFAYSGHAQPQAIPDFRGAGQENMSTFTHSPFGEFFNNEAYGLMTYGLKLAYTTGPDTTDAPAASFTNSRFWNIGHSGVHAERTSNTTFDSIEMVFDPVADDRNERGATGFHFTDGSNKHVAIRNAHVEGAYIGIRSPNMDGSTFAADDPTLVTDSTLRNHVNILFFPPNTLDNAVATSMTVDNVLFTGRTGHALPSCCGEMSESSQKNIKMSTQEHMSRLFGRTRFIVRNYNQTPGNDFQVFFKEQSGSALMPKTATAYLTNATITSSPAYLGSPDAGRTNSFNWNRHRLVTGGRLTSCLDDVTHPEIHGYTCPVQPLPESSVKPYVAVAVPWDGAQMAVSNAVPVYYTVVENMLPAGYDVYFVIDEQTPFKAAPGRDVLWPIRFPGGIVEGAHTLHAYIGHGVTGEPLSGSVIECIAFGASVTNPPTVHSTSGRCASQYLPVP